MADWLCSDLACAYNSQSSCVGGLLNIVQHFLYLHQFRAVQSCWQLSHLYWACLPQTTLLYSSHLYRHTKHTLQFTEAQHTVRMYYIRQTFLSSLKGGSGNTYFSNLVARMRLCMACVLWSDTSLVEHSSSMPQCIAYSRSPHFP